MITRTKPPFFNVGFDYHARKALNSMLEQKLREGFELCSENDPDATMWQTMVRKTFGEVGRDEMRSTCWIKPVSKYPDGLTQTPS